MKNSSKPKNSFINYYAIVDFIGPFYTKKALDVINWQFDKNFIYGWGIDWDCCYQIRKNGLKVAIDYNSQIKHYGSTTYKNKRDKEFSNEHEYHQKASKVFHEVMEKKYGINWRERIINLI
ncbi:MAG: hypothetical protein NZZ41_06040 [Candidatus Dojkabacteria bacterium]|nr:hypothetical protein [Candidatus Dojkabacteria bacterium]